MTPDLHVTSHAVERCIERVPGIKTEIEARAVLTSPTIHLAADEGVPFVKLGTGQHVVIDRHRIITVLPSDTHPSALRTERDQFHRRNF